MTATFDDVVNVPERLTPPAAFQDEMNRQIDEIGGKLGLIDDIWQAIFGWSLLRKVLEPITGDWGQMRSAADGWVKLGSAVEGLSENLAAFAEALDQAWDGQAADAYARHMGKWQETLAAERATTEDMSAKIDDAADQILALFRVITATINLVVEIILLALRLASIPVYGQLKAIQKAKEALSAVRKVFSLIKELFEIVEAFQAYCEALVDAWRECNDNLPWPNSDIAVP